MLGVATAITELSMTLVMTASVMNPSAGQRLPSRAITLLLTPPFASRARPRADPAARGGWPRGGCAHDPEGCGSPSSSPRHEIEPPLRLAVEGGRAPDAGFSAS